jgi:SAM-dependent methyltransferase
MALGMNIPGSILMAQLWWYSYSVLRPAQLLKSAGLYPLNELGTMPPKTGRKGAGRYYCAKYREPVYLEKAPSNYDSVEKFDELSRTYGTFVEPFSGPVFEETIKYMQQYLTSSSRILDCSCGPGTETLRLAPLVSDGEIVGMDLSAEMVAVASKNAARDAKRNVAFFQADVASMPAHFKGRFDAVYCSLAFHHYTHPLEAIREMRRVLRPDGKVFIIDAGPRWMKLLASPMAKWADPGWVAFRTGEEFRVLFQKAGYSGFYWAETLPGMGLSIATK